MSARTNKWLPWLLIGVAVGVGAASILVSSGEPDAREAARRDQATGVYPDYGLDGLTEMSDFALVGEVAAVGEPRWNTDDGQDWSDRSGKNDFTAPFVLTPFTINVQDLLWVADSARPLTAGQQVEVWFRNDPSLAAEEGSRPSFGSDGFGVGDRRVFFIHESPLAFEHGYTDYEVLQGGAGPQTWGIDDNTVWPNSRYQTAQIRALAEAGKVGAWAADPRGEEAADFDAAMTRLSLPELTKLLADPTLESVLDSLEIGDVTFSSNATEDETRAKIDARALDIERMLLIPLGAEVSIESATIDIDPDSTQPPKVTVTVEPSEARSFTELVRVIEDGAKSPELVEVTVVRGEESTTFFVGDG